jgi:tritrans,polycis-undecaprenyl-diphosphate synthase [geranylgeranyl-diphosphate specific]
MVDIEELKKGPIPEHIAVIMDGNRRWAKQNGFDIIKGHEAGVNVLENLMNFLSKNSDIRIKNITLYSLSEDNKQKRSPEQVKALMRLFKEGFSKLSKDKRLMEDGIKVSVFGKYKMLPEDVVREIDKCIELTKDNNESFLNFCIAYDGQSEIVEACKKISEKLKNNELKQDDITKETIKSNIFTARFKAPELIIRTGKEKRMSGFLLWDSSYSELYFCDKFWPDIEAQDFLEAIKEFQQRNRGFGS